MSVTAASLLTIVRADTAQHDRGLAQAGKAVDDLVKKDKELERASKDASRELSGMGKAAALAFSAAAIAGAKKMFDAASDLNETISKSNVVFGASARAVEQWSNTTAKSIGQSKEAALGAAAAFGDQLQAMKLTQPVAAEMSVQMTKLASDLASFHNAKPEEAVLALGSALRGESEPISRFGVVMNENALKAQAFKMKLIESTKDALAPATKAAATYALIMEQTSRAQGDFARTADGAANQQRILAAQFQNMAATLGQNLLPVGLRVLGWLNDMLESFNRLPRASQEMGLAILALVAAGGPLIQLGNLMSSLWAVVANLTGAAGLAGVAAGLSGVGVVALGVAASMMVIADALVLIDTFNENNRSREKDASLPDFMKKRQNVSQLGDEISALRGYQEIRAAGRMHGAAPTSALGRALNRGGLSPRSTAEEIEAAIQKLAAGRKRLEAETQKAQDAYYAGLKKAGGGRVAPLPGVGVGGMDTSDLFGLFTPQVPGVDEGAAKKAAAAAKRHAEAVAAIQRKMSDDIAATTQNRFQSEERALNHYMKELVKAGISQVERRKYYEAMLSDIQKRASADRVKTIADELKEDLQNRSDALQKSMKIWEFQVEQGEITRDKFRANLVAQLAAFEKYSDDYMTIARKIAEVDKDRADEHERMLKRMDEGVKAWSDEFLDQQRADHITAVRARNGDKGAVTGKTKVSRDDDPYRDFVRQSRAGGRNLLQSLLGGKGDQKAVFGRFAESLRESLVDVFAARGRDLLKPVLEGFGERLKKAITGSVEGAEAGVARMLGAVYALLAATGARGKKQQTGSLIGGALALAAAPFTGGASLAYLPLAMNAGAFIADPGVDSGLALGTTAATYGRGGGSGASRGVTINNSYYGPINDRADGQRITREQVARFRSALESRAG